MVAVGFVMNNLPLMAQVIEDRFTENQLATTLFSDEVYLSYSTTDTLAVISGMSRESEFVCFQSLNPLFWKCLQSFRKRLKAADIPGADIDGELLYQYLVEPLKNQLLGKRRLMVRTDSTLFGIPFEAFIRTFENDGHGRISRHYLIHDFEVVYVEQEDEAKHDPWAGEGSGRPGVNIRFSFMGFSPTRFFQDQVSPLPDARHEIEQIGTMFRERGLSSWLVYEHFSEKDYFKQVSPMGQIVHIATHYFSGKDGLRPSGFLFWDYAPGSLQNGSTRGVLTAEEIERLGLNADLVVLNACSSGIVYNKKGRSMSVPMLFFRAGARNVVSTLWNVTDRISGEFMVAFYRNILMGKGYGEALREVKLQMLSCRETAVPALWAPYILTSR
jgi:CHAT domain-containing protein